MKFVKVFWIFIILVNVLKCEAATTYSTRQANRKQQKLIEASMDLSADPCEDFYQYACGNWPQLHKDAGDKYGEALSLIDYTTNKELARVFNRMNFRNKPKYVKKAYDYYKSCKDIKKYETLQYIKWMKEHENLKWPTLWTPPKITVEFDWLKTLAVMRIYGLNNIFIEEMVIQRRDDPSIFIIDLDKPVSGGGFEALTQEQLKLTIEYLAVPMTTKAFSKLWLEIQEFELKLKELDDIEDVQLEGEAEGDDGRDPLLITVKELPFPLLKDYVKILLNQTDLNPNMEIYIENVPYIQALDNLITQHNQRFLCKYLELRFLWHLSLQGPSNFIDEDCVSSARNFLPMAMHWLFEHQHLELQQEFPKITEIYENIRKHFNKTVQKNEHGFNKTVVDYLLAKINNMQLKINNIPRLDTIKTLENFYENLTLNTTDFYGNHLKLFKFNFEASHSLLDSSGRHKEFLYLESWDTGASSSPYFIQRSNMVVVPITFLKPPIYHPDLDDIYKYSSLGFLMAHEIIHGFDNSGLQIDHKGKLVSPSYQAIQSNPLFNASYSCLLELNPSVIDEKIADISGLRYAYQIFYDSNPDAETKSHRIYGRDVSMGKLFFLNFAQFFCNALNSEEYDAAHGPDRDRVLDALTHFPEFAKVYQCDSESRMHSHETCHIWRR